MEVRYGEKEITALLQKIRSFDPAIGSYEFFTINHSFEYLVKLSNGSILFKINELFLNESNDLPQNVLEEIAGRFIPEGLVVPKVVPVASKNGMKSGIVLMVTVVALVAGGIIIAALRNNRNSKRVYIETKVEEPVNPSTETESSDYSSGSQTSASSSSAIPSPVEEAALEQKASEMRDPFGFLKVSTDYRITIIMNLQIEGTVRSTATKASYRNITVRVKFYDKNDELIGQEDHLIPDILAPGQKADFSFKAVGRYGRTAKVIHELVSATPF